MARVTGVVAWAPLSSNHGRGHFLPVARPTIRCIKRFCAAHPRTISTGPVVADDDNTMRVRPGRGRFEKYGPLHILRLLVCTRHLRDSRYATETGEDDFKAFWQRESKHMLAELKALGMKILGRKLLVQARCKLDIMIMFTERRSF